MEIQSGIIKKRLIEKLNSDSLLLELKKLRSRCAAEQRVPAYIVFSDATLIDMCSKLPKNIGEFGRVKGVGLKKQEQYGEEFVDLIKRFIIDKPRISERSVLNTNEFKENACIQHRSFGIGRIISIDGDYAVIKFAQQSDVKKFNLEMCIKKNLIQTVNCS